MTATILICVNAAIFMAIFIATREPMFGVGSVILCGIAVISAKLDKMQ